MARVIVAPGALDDLTSLIRTHSLPADTVERVQRSLRPLGLFPFLGPQLDGRWQGFRFILGPWRWLIVVYVYDEEADQISVVTIQDGRSARSATTAR